MLISTYYNMTSFPGSWSSANNTSCKVPVTLQYYNSSVAHPGSKKSIFNHA